MLLYFRKLKAIFVFLVSLIFVTLFMWSLLSPYSKGRPTSANRDMDMENTNEDSSLRKLETLEEHLRAKNLNRSPPPNITSDKHQWKYLRKQKSKGVKHAKVMALLKARGISKEAIKIFYNYCIPNKIRIEC